MVALAQGYSGRTRAIDYRELKRQYDLLGPHETEQRLADAIFEGHLKTKDFNIRELFEALIPDGREILQAIGYGKSGRRQLAEAAGAVDTSAFSNITGQIIYSTVIERYTDPDLLWPQLVTMVGTVFLNGERIPGIGRAGDRAEIVAEGQPYPMIGLNEEFVDTQPLEKRGFIIPITREIIIADRTGLLLERAGDEAYFLSLNREKRIMLVVVGTTNTYKRNGVSTNTYLTSGAYINSSTTALVDWTSIQTVELLFDVLTDPNTGELIDIKPDTLIVPSALKRTANRILTASEIAHVDNTVSATTIRTFSPNPYGGAPYKVLSNSHVKEATGSATSWFFGQPKRAFSYHYAWDIESVQAPAQTVAEFTQDIQMQFKVSEMGKANVLEPRYMAKGNT